VHLHLDVADTALALATDLQSGNPAQTQDAGFITSTTLTSAGGTLTAAQLSLLSGISQLSTGTTKIPVQDTAAAIAGLSASARGLAGSVWVQDSAINVALQLNPLQSDYSGNLTITLTGQSPSLSISSSTYMSDHATIDAITNLACVTVIGTAEGIATIAATLAADPHVVAVDVNDDASNVVSYLPAIESLGSEVTVNLQGPESVSASVASALVAANLPHINYGSIVVVDTPAQIAAMAESSTAAQAFLTQHPVFLNSDGNVSLVDANALFGLFNLDLYSYTVNIWDTASHLTQPGAATAIAELYNSGEFGGFYLQAPGDSVTLSAANAVALLSIPYLNTNNPDGTRNSIYVADTVANLYNNYATLLNDLATAQPTPGPIDSITVTASATVSEPTLADLQNLHAVAGIGVTLTLSDSPANILTAAAVLNPTIAASSYALNGSYTITQPQALGIAALSNFSAGTYTLTVNPNGQLPDLVTVTQANELGALGSSLSVPVESFYISGSVAALASLTKAAAAVVSVTLHDTIASILTLSPTSPLLTGLIDVSMDQTGLTAAQASAFVSLLNSAGVNSDNVSFTCNEHITDSIANLRALTTSTAWTANPGLASNFDLVASDTAANLTNPANAAFLQGIYGETLSATTTVSAAMAESLASLPNFSVTNGHSLLVSDSAANLLMSSNAAGLAAASSITLNAPATVSAANAETLLHMSNFHLTQLMTVSDTSSALLDGTLGPLIANNTQVQVTLSGPQTVDTSTAEALVALQGFADTTHMTIADTSSYLLQSAASLAESMAAAVVLSDNETVSANTILRLSEIPNFSDTGGTLTLAGNDYVDTPTFEAILNLGSHFSSGGFALTLTQNVLSLTPTEFTAYQNQEDPLHFNGYVIAVMPVNASDTDTGGTLSVTATGLSGATVNVYNAAGTAIVTEQNSPATFTVNIPDAGTGNNFSITETNLGGESAPLVVLDQSALENLVGLSPTSFASTGQIQIDTGKYINLYTAGATLPNAPALVYSPTAHTISLEMPNASPVVLITLGASTTPASLEPSEILIKHHS
jgi:hypothetical protein